MYNKRGEALGWILTAGLLVIIAIAIMGAYTPKNVDVLLTGTPGVMVKMIDGIKTVADPIANMLYTAVAPVGANDNTKAIAFAVFLLITLVGYTATKGLFNPVIALLISGIVGVIAGRGLTDTVLAETALSASPIAAVSLILGFLPIFVLTKKIKDWKLTKFTELVIFAVAGVIYALVFSFAFQATTLGIVYGVGVILVGIGQTVIPALKAAETARKNKVSGKFAARLGRVESVLKQMQKGAEQEEEEGAVKGAEKVLTGA